MRGAYEKLKSLWPQEIDRRHDDFGVKASRYQTGSDRLSFLQQHAQPFAYRREENGDEIVAFLTELEPEDLDPRMPESIRCEYVCGKISGNGVCLFSYIWFESIHDAHQYAIEHGMRIEGGWHE